MSANIEVAVAGHEYKARVLDGEEGQMALIRFVMRNDPPDKYPGNDDAFPGVIIQELLRAILDRMDYLDKQNPCDENKWIMGHLREAFMGLEIRAHRRHDTAMPELDAPIETYEPCPTCGHIFCTWCKDGKRA